ncbi:MAG TPA: thiamine phosphate synthase [Acidiferrobacterales bacterium]|nr:thiamine phosphate synthase [Acidiferrobacterales bacterium]
MPSGPPRVTGLYAIADSAYLAAEQFVPAVRAALDGGARVIQYRDKKSGAKQREAIARALNALCREHAVPLLINDDVALAALVGAAGVHLGRDDPDIAAARAALGPTALIGVSCYNELARAQAAQAMGADYVAFGRFFPSRTKPQAVPATPELLRAARAGLNIPIVAIGGITPENGASLIAAGADALAVIEGVFNQPDIRAAAERYARLFE